MRTFFFPWRKYPACDCSLPDDPYNHEGLQPTRNMFNNNEAIEPKQREKTVDDNTGTITMSVEQLCASVYMWNEGSHSSDLCWFGAKFESGSVGKIIIPWGGVHKKNVHNMCILFNLSRRKSVVVRDLNIANYCMFWQSVISAAPQ